jgi:multisubunit Na+/H+ antiporter MnhC subunit
MSFVVLTAMSVDVATCCFIFSFKSKWSMKKTGVDVEDMVVSLMSSYVTLIHP